MVASIGHNTVYAPSSNANTNMEGLSCNTSSLLYQSLSRNLSLCSEKRMRKHKSLPSTGCSYLFGAK